MVSLVWGFFGKILKSFEEPERLASTLDLKPVLINAFSINHQIIPAISKSLLLAPEEVLINWDVVSHC